MITLVEALHYRCLQSLSRPLERLQILVGPNASGKTTFLDAISFLGTFVGSGPEAAFRERTQNPLDLLWGRRSDALELALEAQIPASLRERLPESHFDTVRYEIGLRLDEATYQPLIQSERLALKASLPPPVQARLEFPQSRPVRDSILAGRTAGRAILNKVFGGNDNFYSEIRSGNGKTWAPSYKLGPLRSTLGNLPADDSKFPVSIWLKELLQQGVQRIVLNSLMLKQASPPGSGRVFRADGSNFPWVLMEFRDKYADRFRDWLAHVRTALGDIQDIRIVVREDDKHAYLVIHYHGGLQAPSWVVSDGTLRLLALTSLAYIPDSTGVYLIEEPENGIHPTAVETIYQSLSSVYSGQVLVASHSPVLLSCARPEHLLCFARDEDGATDIVRGDEHPALAAWRREVPLGAFLASGVLG